MNEIKIARQHLREENKRHGFSLTPYARSEWSEGMQVLAGTHPSKAPVQVWRSRDFLVQLYFEAKTGFHRLSCTRTELKSDGSYKDGITWDELMRLKREAGFGNKWAVECYPADAEIVNVANHRHLFLLPAKPPFGW